PCPSSPDVPRADSSTAYANTQTCPQGTDREGRSRGVNSEPPSSPEVPPGLERQSRWRWPMRGEPPWYWSASTPTPRCPSNTSTSAPARRSKGLPPAQRHNTGG